MAVDDFNRADSNDLGVNWTESDYSTPNSLRILNNRLRMGEANWIAHYNGTFADDQYVEATVTGMQFGDGQTGIDHLQKINMSRLQLQACNSGTARLGLRYASVVRRVVFRRMRRFFGPFQAESDRKSTRLNS